MKLSKIGSKVTYHKCIKELHHWSYLEYRPSHNPFKGSNIIMFNFCTAPEQALVRTCKENGQELIPSKTNINNKHNKHKRQPKKIEETEIYFLEKKSTTLESQKFFNYYEANGWKVGGKAPMKDWKAAARNWIIKADEIKKEKTRNAPEQKLDNLKVKTDKNYGEPL